MLYSQFDFASGFREEKVALPTIAEVGVGIIMDSACFGWMEEGNRRSFSATR